MYNLESLQDTINRLYQKFVWGHIIGTFLQILSGLKALEDDNC